MITKSSNSVGVIIVRWVIITLIGYTSGWLLESIHNHILCTIDIDSTLMPELSSFIIRTFRSEYTQRLITGWASSLSSVFAVVGLITGLLLCLTLYWKRADANKYSICSTILDINLLCHLLLFFVLAIGLVAPLTSIHTIMGADSQHIITGATFTGNLISKMGHFAWIPLIYMLYVMIMDKTV